MAKAGRVHHWKHGWIPLDAEARAIVAARGKKDGLDGHQMPALDVPAFDDLPPALQTKIGAKLETLTGVKEPELADRVQANLVRLYQEADKSHGGWYAAEKAGIAARAASVERDFPGYKLSPEQLTGMIAVTSAKKRWKENEDFAEKISRKLAADQPFRVEQSDIDDYNAWAGKRVGGLAKVHPEITPGTYRPSELPSDFAASRTPGMPKHLNTDYVIRAVQIANGDVDLEQSIAGPKQRSFVSNLSDPADKRFVTVDTWHYRAAMSGIPITYTIGPKGHQKTYNYTLEQWTDRDLAARDGRAKLFGYDGRRDRYEKANQAATIAATKMEPQTFFQAGPSSVAAKYKSNSGTYPWFVKQTQLAADTLGVSPNAVQAVAWYAVGGGA